MAPGDVGADENTTHDPSGVVVYEYGDGIYRTTLGQKERVLLARDASYPRWSPDGKHVAFVRGNRIMRMASSGKGEEVLATAREARAVAYHPNGREVLFTDGSAVRSVSLEDRQVRTVISGHVVRELDLSGDGRRLVATVKRRGYHVFAFDLATGKHWRLGRGCSASISPDGRMVTVNGGDHTRLSLRSWETGEKIGTVRAPPGRRFDNQFWSNEQDWLAGKAEGEPEDIFVHQISADRAIRVTFSGSCDRPDLFISETR